MARQARSSKGSRPRRRTVSGSSKRRLTINLNRILVPIDFSESSKKALKYAIPFARQFGASIDLIYVVEPTIYPADFSFGQVGFPNVEEELRARGEAELKGLVKDLVRRQVPASVVIRTGKAFYEIDQYAREENIDLIIIATHGHSGVEQFLFGSTTEKVVRKAPCPVLVVRSGEREFVK